MADPTRMRPILGVHGCPSRSRLGSFERVHGLPLQEAFNDLIFRPLGLSRTFLPGTSATDAAEAASPAPAAFWAGDDRLDTKPGPLRSFRRPVQHPRGDAPLHGRPRPRPPVRRPVHGPPHERALQPPRVLHQPAPRRTGVADRVRGSGWSATACRASSPASGRRRLSTDTPASPGPGFSMSPTSI